MIKGKKVLITGGGGFIGVSLAEKLVNDNRILLVDVNFENNSFLFSDLKDHKNVKLHKINVLDHEKLSQVVKEADIVVHTAAILSVPIVIHNPILTLEVNYKGSSNLLKASLEHRVERFIFFSTSEIFGLNAFNTSENGSMAISDVEDARWCYSLSKLSTEHLVRGYHKKFDLPTVIIRPFNVFGPKRIGDYAILRFVLRALKNKDLIVYGDGSQIRAWCYITDFIDALLSAMESKAAIGHAFNVGNPLNTLTIYQLAKQVLQITGSKSKIILETPCFSDIDIRVPNIKKAKKLLNFKPKVDMTEGLIKTTKWYEEYLPELEKLVRNNLDAMGRKIL